MPAPYIPGSGPNSKFSGVPPVYGSSTRVPNSGVAVSPGGRSNAARIAATKAVAARKKASAKGQGVHIPAATTTTTLTSAPAQTNLTPDVPTGVGTTDPNSLNLMDNTKLAGLSGTVQLPNAMNYANSMANLQYGPQIAATTARIKGLTAALPGALDALNKAFANVDAQRQQAAPITSGAGVANLFGGAQGAAAVAANQAVQANNTTANQIGQGNDEANADARRQADWATRIQLLNNMNVNQAQSDLVGEQGQLGDAKKAYYDQGLKMRGDMISQAISNQGALNNQKVTNSLAANQIESSNLTNQQKAEQLKQLGIQTSYAPTLASLAVQGAKQNIITSQLQNNLTVKQAQQALKGATGVTNLKQALGAGGANAIYGLILPAGAVTADSTTGRPQVFGDLNTYFNKGVAAIMANLPGSNKKNVKQYVANELQKVASETNQWVYKNGRFQRVAQPKTTTTK